MDIDYLNDPTVSVFIDPEMTAYPQKAYDQFIDILNAKLAGEPLQPLANYQPSQQLEIYAIDAVLTQLKATHLLRELHQQQSVTQVD